MGKIAYWIVRSLTAIAGIALWGGIAFWIIPNLNLIGGVALLLWIGFTYCCVLAGFLYAPRVDWWIRKRILGKS